MFTPTLEQVRDAYVTHNNPENIMSLGESLYKEFETFMAGRADTADKAYRRGFDEGFEEGYDEGFEKGYDEGFEEGYEVAK